MRLYNHRGLHLKKKKKEKKRRVLFHTDTALICIVFPAASLKIQILSAKEQ